MGRGIPIWDHVMIIFINLQQNSCRRHEGAWPLANRRNSSSRVNWTVIIISTATPHNFLEALLVLGRLFLVAFVPPLSSLGGHTHSHTNDALLSGVCACSIEKPYRSITQTQSDSQSPLWNRCSEGEEAPSSKSIKSEWSVFPQLQSYAQPYEKCSNLHLCPEQLSQWKEQGLVTVIYIFWCSPV